MAVNSENKNVALVVAIDGPSGSGKSTLAKKVASKLEYLYVDTGAMYRAVGLYLKRNTIDFENESMIQESLKEMSLNYGPSKDILIELNGENVSEKIRDHEVSSLASKVSKSACVRKLLVDLQRELASKQYCVMEGRDIGTNVFPNAFIKFFLTASSKVRAQRRVDQLKEKGQEFDFQKIHDDIVQRDHEDQTRKLNPLIKADDALEIDTRDMSIDQVMNKIVETVKGRTDG